MTNSGSQGRIHRRDVTWAGLWSLQMGRKKEDPGNINNAKCTVEDNAKARVCDEWGASILSLYAGDRMHKMKWRKKTPLEPASWWRVLGANEAKAEESLSCTGPLKDPGKGPISCVHCALLKCVKVIYFALFFLKNIKY